MYGCDSWTVKKAERQRIYDFELWCRRRLSRVPWTARRSNQSIPKEISPRCSLEGLMLKVKLQYFGHLMRRVDSLEKTLMLGGIGGRRRRERQRMRWHHPSWWTWVWVISIRWWWTGIPGVLQFMGSQSVGHDWASEMTELTFPKFQRAVQLIREGRGCKNRGEAFKWWYSLRAKSGSSSRKTHNKFFEFFYGTGIPTQVEDDNFRMSTRFLEHHPVASPQILPSFSGDQW